MSFAALGGRVLTFPGRRIVIEGAPEQRFVSLRISPLVQVEYADGKDLWSQTTYRGPVELVTRTWEGDLLRRRAFGVEISGYGKRDPVTVRLR